MERSYDLAVADLFYGGLQKMEVRSWLFIDLIDPIILNTACIRFMPQVDAKVLPEEFENDEPENEELESRRYAK